MRIARKPLVFGTSAVMVTAIVALFALWAWIFVGGGPTSNAGLTWNVEFWHHNADGKLLQHKQASNAIVASGLEHAVERLIAAGSGDIALPLPTQPRPR